jgi:hypothetical protein
MVLAMTDSAFDVPAGQRREPTAAERFARRQLDPHQGADEPPRERTVRVRAVLDALSIILVMVGLTVGDVAAWIAGGTVPGLATLAGAIVVLGLLLTL